ncbi:MAG: HD domain-containing protein [Desulfovibrio sp.]|jgi:(p)ppGpp synthase/HD superfamily hydrolase|nr:HD domain-containing protein [Desulfovibrio sp.]
MAWIYATYKHRHQLYPGSEKIPYMAHISAVVITLIPALVENMHYDEVKALCCAVLHDTIADTDATKEQIEELFGTAIAEGVSALSKDKLLQGEAATLDSLERIKLQSKEVWLVKLADRIANLQTPPNHWSKEKCHTYAREGERILEALGSASPMLAQKLAVRISAWKEL